MRDFFERLILFLLAIGIIVTLIFTIKEENKEKPVITDILLDIVVTDTNRIDIKIADWHHFIDAMIHEESKNNASAVGSANDVGVLQITPIYVEEANRILGYKRYSLEDRLDKYKSIEIFNVINDKHNPERSFHKAMLLHNPKAPESYRKSILKYYYNIR